MSATTADTKAQDIEREKERILDYLASVPDHGMTSCTTVVLRAIMLHTHGRMWASGYTYDIKTKSLGAGVYRIWLAEKKDYKGENTK